jgi:phosphomannomutase
VTVPADLAAQVEAWIADDPDEHDRAELRRLLDAADVDELASRFAGPLEFGTAGLRGAVGAGETRMNRAVVRRASVGLASYVTAHSGGSVVVGRDARHRSDEFAAEAAAVFAGAGLRAFVLPEPLPTPVLAFAVRHLGCAAGVMVTASHNPPADNGYKVYLGDGAQIVPPADADISAAIAAVTSLRYVPMSDEVTVLGDDVLAAYVDAVAALAPAPVGASLNVVTTPLHGVGGGTLLRAMNVAGWPAPHVVAQQAVPDPDFPTVAFPNPEEPGALDLALAAARECNADVVIANDPDADRMDAAIPDPSLPGGWRVLRGDELGVLLGDDILRRSAGPDRLVANSVVSSSMLARIAAAHGVHFRETLTGFKWIARAADDLPGVEFAFGYEEALGFCVGHVVRDKDGISAALALLRLIAELRADGLTLLDRLDELDRQHGVHLTEQVAIRVEGAEALDRIRLAVDAVRNDPPKTLAGMNVSEVLDLNESPTGLPPTDALVLRCADVVRVVVRPSGTEPKLKSYLQVVTPAHGDLHQARDQARALLNAVRHDVEAALPLAT